MADANTTTTMSARAAEPVGPYPHAKRVGNLLFLSGIGPRKRGSKDIPGVTLRADGSVESYDIVAQCRSVFENIRLVLEDSGSKWENIVEDPRIIKPDDPRRKAKIVNVDYDHEERQKLGRAIRSVRGLAQKAAGDTAELLDILGEGETRPANEVRLENIKRFDCGDPVMNDIYGQSEYKWLIPDDLWGKENPDTGKAWNYGDEIPKKYLKFLDPMTGLPTEEPINAKMPAHVAYGDKTGYVEIGIPSSFVATWGGEKGVGKSRLAIALEKSTCLMHEGRAVLHNYGESNLAQLRQWPVRPNNFLRLPPAPDTLAVHMNRAWWRRRGVVAFASVALVLFILFLVAPIIAKPIVRAKLQAEVGQHFNARVEIGSLSWLPMWSVTVHDLRLVATEPTNNTPFDLLHADRVSISLAGAPFGSGPIIAKNIAIDSPVVRMIETRDGVAGLNPKPAPPSAPDPRPSIGSRIPKEQLPPLGLLSIGGPLIDAGHDVTLLDAEIGPMSHDEVVRRAVAHRADAMMFGHSGSTSAHPMAGFALGSRAGGVGG